MTSKSKSKKTVKALYRLVL